MFVNSTLILSWVPRSGAITLNGNVVLYLRFTSRNEMQRLVDIQPWFASQNTQH